MQVKPKPKKKSRKSRAKSALVVPPVQPTVQPLASALDPKSIQSLDIQALKRSMGHGIYVLEAALFSQAQFEFARVDRQRRIVEKLEDEIFNEKTLSALTPSQKSSLYHTSQQAMSNSLNFLTDLHGAVASGLEAVNHIEKLSTDRSISSTPKPQDPDLERVRALIRDKLRDKVSKPKPESE